MKYSVIIPVVNINLVKRLLDSIAGNTVLPYKILIIDNSMNKTVFPTYGGLSIEVFDSGRCMGVNESWNLGISRIDKCDYAAILNDDIVLGKYFFENNIDTFECYPNCGAVCPETVNDINMMKDSKVDRVLIMTKREGWAMSFRWEVLKQIPPIPDHLKTFCGDDWYWLHSYLKNKQYWLKNMGNVIYHEVGVSVLKLGLRDQLRHEKNIYRSMR